MVLREIAESILSFTRDYWKYNYTESIMGFNLLHITESILEIPSVSPPPPSPHRVPWNRW